MTPTVTATPNARAPVARATAVATTVAATDTASALDSAVVATSAARAAAGLFKSYHRGSGGSLRRRAPSAGPTAAQHHTADPDRVKDSKRPRSAPGPAPADLRVPTKGPSTAHAPTPPAAQEVPAERQKECAGVVRAKLGAQSPGYGILFAVEARRLRTSERVALQAALVSMRARGRKNAHDRESALQAPSTACACASQAQSLKERPRPNFEMLGARVRPAPVRTPSGDCTDTDGVEEPSLRKACERERAQALDARSKPHLVKAKAKPRVRETDVDVDGAGSGRGVKRALQLERGRTSKRVHCSTEPLGPAAAPGARASERSFTRPPTGTSPARGRTRLRVSTSVHVSQSGSGSGGGCAQKTPVFRWAPATHDHISIVAGPLAAPACPAAAMSLAPSRAQTPVAWPPGSVRTVNVDDTRATRKPAVPARALNGHGGEHAQGLHQSQSPSTHDVDAVPAAAGALATTLPAVAAAKPHGGGRADSPPQACGVLHRVHDQTCGCARCLPPIGQGMPREMWRMALLSAQMGWPLVPAPDAPDARKGFEASWCEARRNAELNSKAPLEAACVDRKLLDRFLRVRLCKPAAFSNSC